MKRPLLILLVFAILLVIVVPIIALFVGRVPHADANLDEVVEFLPEAKNNGERCLPSPVYYSEASPYVDLGEGLLDKNCFDLHAVLHRSAQHGDLNAIRESLARGANVNAPVDDYTLLRPLRTAVVANQLDAARLLLDNGADVNDEYMCCMTSDTPLMKAIENNNAEMVELLLSRGADATYATKFEPYSSVAGQSFQKGNVRIATMVLAARLGL